MINDGHPQELLRVLEKDRARDQGVFTRSRVPKNARRTDDRTRRDPNFNLDDLSVGEPSGGRARENLGTIVVLTKRC